MFIFKENSDPVGVVRRLDAVEERIAQYSRIWDEASSRRSFWKPSVNLSKVTNFLLFALDGLITTVGAEVIAGPDKKATVLDAVSRLYDYTVREAMPIWMRPFAAPIKNYIVYVLVSSAIDWIVAKYQSGSWKPAPARAWDGKFVPCRTAKGGAS